MSRTLKQNNKTSNLDSTIYPVDGLRTLMAAVEATLAKEWLEVPREDGEPISFN